MEKPTRLETLEKDLTEIKNKVANLEIEVAAAKTEQANMKVTVARVEANTNEILAFVSGGKKVFGFAKRNWKTALTFGCGIMTAAGIGNPKVTAFIQTFFGLG